MPERVRGKAVPLAEPGSRSVTVLLILAVLLFAMMLRGEHILVTAAGDPAIAAIQVATFLSSVLLAGLLLGGAAGVAAVRVFAGRDGTRLAGHPRLRTLYSVLGGLVSGVIAGGAGYLLEADLSTTDRLIVGSGVAVAALLGGVAAALRPGLMIVAGMLGTLLVIAVLAVRSLFLSPLTRLFGGEGTIHAYATAQSRLALVSFIVAGLLAGVLIHVYLRRTGNRLGTAANVAAGATAGVLTLVAQLLTWVFGRGLISSAGGLDLGDALAFQLAGRYQINGALALLFAGALVTVLLYGRTRGPRRPRQQRAPAAKPGWAVREEKRAAELDRASGEKTTAAGERSKADKPVSGSGTRQSGSRQPSQSRSKQATGAKPTDAKPADAKPARVKPADAKPTEAEPARAKPTEAKSAGAKPARTKSAGAKSTGARSTDSDRAGSESGR